MIQLPNNCRMSDFSVYPVNWKTARANIGLTWYIKYRFYDDNLKEVKQIMIKRMNEFTTLKEKQEAVRFILEDELNELKNKGYNKITKQYALQEEEITEHTPFIE